MRLLKGDQMRTDTCFCLLKGEYLLTDTITLPWV